MNKVTLVIGASLNSNKYSNIAIRRLVDSGFKVRALGLKKGIVAGVNIETAKISYTNIHTVTLYLNAKNQQEFYNYIIALNPKRILFNPGAENPEFEEILVNHNIAFERACTLVLLSIGGY